VAPGFVPVERHAGVTHNVRSSYVASVPAGRFGTRDDIAHAVSFFASEEAAFTMWATSCSGAAAARISRFSLLRGVKLQAEPDRNPANTVD
jgi:NAD(P)-dependent dehydrogenase (short-subunit alcohol dehydrogenase family)